MTSETRKTSIDSNYVKIGVNTNAKLNESKIQIIHTNETLPQEKSSLGLLARLEHTFTINDLEELKNAFEAVDAKTPGGLKLSKYEFASFVSSVISKGSPHEYDELFDNIDVTKSGYVDWDKFASYMLLMLYETDDKTKAYSIPNWKPIKNINNQHRDAIKRIQYVKNLNCYISISKEGTCCVFDNNVNLSSYSKVTSTSCKSRDLWVTDFVILPNVNKIALAFTTKEIEIYDCSKLDFNCQFRISNFPAIALCLDYWYDENNDNDAILLWGDTLGSIHSIHFNSAKIALFERPSASSGTEKQEICLQVNIDEIKSKYKNATYISYKGHSGWVRQIKWASHLECIISCCGTDKCSLNLGWFEKTNSSMRIPHKRSSDYKNTIENDYYYPNIIKGINNNENNNNNNNDDNNDNNNSNTNQNDNNNNIVINNPSHVGSVNFNNKENSQEGRKSQFDVPHGGVNAFDYDDKLNLIATANANNNINLYNPYVQEANGILKGHMRSVIAVKFVKSRAQLISFSKDKVLRIWNVHLQMGIQRVANVFPKGPDVDITCYFDDHYNRLFTTFRNLINMLEIKPEIKDRVMTHNKPVVAARFNKINNQVLSLSQDGTLIMWLIDNGQKIKTFVELHGTAEVTCMEFDESNTKFFTAGTDGTIKVWDFNGHCYHTLDAGDGHSCEISQVLPLKRRVIAVGWTKEITVFRDSMFRDIKVKQSEWKGREEHEEDILCTAIMQNQPMTLVTGGFDGDIIVWNSVTELPTKHLTARKRRSSNKNQQAEPFKKDTTLLSVKSEKVRHKSSKTASSKKSRQDTQLAIDPDMILNQNDFSFAITCLRFLQTRSPHKDATLVSCGGNGWLRIWDITNAELIAEFVAHLQASSIIMEIDSTEQYLATGDVNGNIKVWNISDYCRNIHMRQQKNVITDPPPLVSTIKSHSDVINSIDFCFKNEIMLIITASSDCSVSLHTIFGVKIGVFGQDDHWKIENFLFNSIIPEINIAEITKEIENNKTSEEKNDIELKEEMEKNIMNEINDNNSDTIIEMGLCRKLNKDLTIEETFTYENDAFVKNPNLRYNPWSKTILGKGYQEARVKKRDRKQPGIIATEEFLIWEKTGQTPGGLYGSLITSDLAPASELKEPKKPDFIKNPHRYFRDKDAVKLSDLEKHVPSLAETLNSAFDEKTLFPKYILDYEARMKQEHKKILESSAAETTFNMSTRKKRNSISSIFN